MSCQCCGHALVLPKKQKRLENRLVIIKLDTDKSYKCCPHCSYTDGSSHRFHLYPEKFGERRASNGKKIPQSWCKKCRALRNKSIPSKVFQEGLLCSDLLSPQAEVKIIDIIDNKLVEKETLIASAETPDFQKSRTFIQFIQNLYHTAKTYLQQHIFKRDHSKVEDEDSIHAEQAQQLELIHSLQTVSKRLSSLADKFDSTP